MPSRKRNKGKERKAKKIEKKRDLTNSMWCLARGGIINGKDVINCDHGLNLVIPDGQGRPVIRFMEECWLSATDWNATLHSHPEVWENDKYREMTRKILVTLGVNLLLRDASEISMHISFANTIMVLESYDCSSDVYQVCCTRGVATKLQQLQYGNMRDVLKFYSKRISCKCLKAMHSNARKNLPKIGCCYNCNEEMERAQLSVCSRCRIVQYCSRECQVAHWPKHQRSCNFFVNIHEYSQLSCM